MSPLTDLTQYCIYLCCTFFQQIHWEINTLIQGPSYTVQIHNGDEEKSFRLLRPVQDNLQTRQRKVKDTEVEKTRQKIKKTKKP